MASIQEIRQKYPQYNDMSDQDFADKFHAKYYSDIPKDQFYEKIGLSNKKQGLFDFDKNKSEQDFSKLSGQVLKESPYVAQGAINEPGKMANVLLPQSMQIPKINIANKLSSGISPEENKSAEELGGLLGMGLPRAGILGGLKAAQGIPHIGKVLEHAMKASPILNKLFDVGGRGAEFGLYEAAEHPEQAGTRGALGFSLGAGLSGLGHGVPAIANKLGFGKQPGQEAIEGLTYEQVAPSVEAAERLGTPLRPSEASRNPFIAGQEGRYPRTREAAAKNVELGMERVQSEKNAIKKLLTTIFPNTKSANNEIKNLYESVANTRVDENVFNNLNKNSLINTAIKDVKEIPAWKDKLEGIPEDSVAYLDIVKRELYKKEKSLKKESPGEAEQYRLARDQLVSELDIAAPKYEEARNLAELKKARSIIKKKMREEEITGSAFFNKIIKPDEEYQKIFNSLRNNPDAQAMLQDMKSAWHSLINVEKPSTASYQSEKAINQARGSLNKVIEIWNQLTGKKKNLEAVKYIRSNKWVNDLKNAQKTGDKSKIESSVNDIMMKILPVSDFAIEGNK